MEGWPNSAYWLLVNPQIRQRPAFHNQHFLELGGLLGRNFEIELPIYLEKYTLMKDGILVKNADILSHCFQINTEEDISSEDKRFRTHFHFFWFPQYANTSLLFKLFILTNTCSSFSCHDLYYKWTLTFYLHIPPIFG